MQLFDLISSLIGNVMPRVRKVVDNLFDSQGERNEVSNCSPAISGTGGHTAVGNAGTVTMGNWTNQVQPNNPSREAAALPAQHATETEKKTG